MELFEILFILLFILFPLIDGLRRGRQKQGPVPDERPRPRQAGRPTGTLERDEASTAEREASRDSESAAGMLPDDLWQVLTGERRQPAPPPEEREQPWQEESWRPEAEPEVRESARYGEATGEWWDVSAPEEVSVPDEVPVPEPDLAPARVSAWESGLEGREPPRVVSLEEMPPPPDVRHRRFHRKYDDDEPVQTRQPSRITASIRDPEGLRRAFVLKEVLGPPKGLD